MSVDITHLTAHLSPEQQEDISREYRRHAINGTTAFLLCFFLGLFGAHRFFLRQWGRGLAHLLIPILIVAALLVAIFASPANGVATALVLVAVVLLLIGLLWEIVDLMRIDGEVHERNLALAERLIGVSALADTTIERQAAAKLDSLVRQTAASAEQAATTEARATERAADAASMPPQVDRFDTAPALGTITADDVANARAMAEESTAASMASFFSTTESEISATPDELRHGAEPQRMPENWSTTETLGGGELATASGDAGAGVANAEEGTHGGALGAEVVGGGLAAAAGFVVAESLTHAHSETDHSVTESVELDRTVGAAETTEEQASAVAESETPTWPDLPPVAFAEPEPVAEETPVTESVAPVEVVPVTSVAPVVTPQAVDMTDHHPHVHHSRPVADVDVAGEAPIYIALGALGAASAPSAVSAVSAAEAAPPPASPPAMSTAEAGIAALGFGVMSADAPAAEAFVPPTVPVISAGEPPIGAPVVPEEPPMGAPVVASGGNEPPDASGETLAELAGLVGATGLAGAGGATLAEHAPEAAPEAAPVAAEPMAPERRQMKRVRVVRRLVVDGQVVEEKVVEELVPVDADTAQTAASLQESLGHASAEQFASLAHLPADAQFDLRQRVEGTQPPQAPDGETGGSNA